LAHRRGDDRCGHRIGRGIHGGGTAAARSRWRVQPHLPAGIGPEGLKGAKDLQPDQQARLQALFVFRDMTARSTNKPPFKIMNDSTLLKLAAKPPMSMKALGNMKGLSPALVRRYGSKLLSLLRKSHGTPLPYPRNNYRRPDEETMQR
jgi:ribonuclease D